MITFNWPKHLTHFEISKNNFKNRKKNCRWSFALCQPEMSYIMCFRFRSHSILEQVLMPWDVQWETVFVWFWFLSSKWPKKYQKWHHTEIHVVAKSSLVKRFCRLKVSSNAPSFVILKDELFTTRVSHSATREATHI